MTLKEYALKILTDAGCDEYTYGGEWSKKIMDDLKQAFPDGMEYPYIEVANAILAMSRPQPIERAPFKMVYDTDHCCDSVDCDSEEEARDAALDCLHEWMAQNMSGWKHDEPSDADKEWWDYMIYNNSVYVVKYNPETDEYETVWEPSYEDEESIGWKPFED